MHAKGPSKPSAAQPLREQSLGQAALRTAAVAGLGIGGMSLEQVVALQRSIGNNAVSRMIEESRHQHGAGCGHPQGATVQRSAVHNVLNGGGQPLAPATRTDMESRLGADFSDVRVHNDGAARASAAELGARAYTSGSHVVIGEGGGNRHTLAHELVHVVQQRRGPVTGTPTADGLSVSDPSDAFERAAEAQATRALSGPAPTASGGAGVQDGRGQVQRTAASADMPVQRLAITDSPSAWSDQPVRRSGEGAAGVYFVGPEGQEVAVKPMTASGNVEYAHTFLGHMNVAAPTLQRYGIKSSEGEAIKALLQARNTGGRLERKAGDLAMQLNTATCFLVMEMVRGATLQGANADEAQQFLSDHDALRQIGRIMVADAFLGNTDRIVGGTVNLGNFLYAVAENVAPGTGTVHAIDNESSFPPAGVEKMQSGGKRLDPGLSGKLTNFDELRRPAATNYFIGRFLQKLNQSHKQKPQVTAILNNPEQAAQIRGWIAQGITAAFADLANVFRDHEDLLKAIGGQPNGNPLKPSLDATAGKAAAKYVSDTQGGVTNTQAAADLMKYVTKECKKAEGGFTLTKFARKFL